MIEIVIGKMGNQPFPITEPTVSRRHALLRKDDDGKLTITDTNSANGTFIKMKDGSFKRITQPLTIASSCILRLGPSLVVKVSDLLPKLQSPEKVDISALRYMIMHYQSNRMQLEQKKTSNNNLRMMMMPVASVLSIAMPIILKQVDEDASALLMWIPPLCVITVCILFYILINIKNRKIIEQQAELERNFKIGYCCPKCHWPFAGKLYEHILNEGQCPKCKVKYYERQDIPPLM